MKIKLFAVLFICVFLGGIGLWAEEVSRDFSSEFGSMLEKNETSKAKDFLFKNVAENDYEAQMTLARIYIGPKEIRGTVYSFSVPDYSDNTHYVEFGRKLGILPDLKKAVSILQKSVESGNSEAGVLLALMLRNGVGVSKNAEAAKKLLEKFSSNSHARFYYEYYFAEIDFDDMEVIDCADLAPKPIEDKDLPYTFIPEKSLNWNETEVEVDSETKYTRKYLKDSSMRPRAEGKVLVPIAALLQLQGSCADNGPAFLLVDPAQSNTFFSKEKVYVKRYSAWVRYEEGGSFSYEWKGALKNGIQILKTYDNGGGSLTTADYQFLAFEKCSRLSINGEKTELIGVRNLGGISFSGKGGLTRYFFCRNVFAVYEIRTNSVWDDEQFSTRITLISFEKSPILFEVAKAELYKKILMFRSEPKTELSCPF